MSETTEAKTKTEKRDMKAMVKLLKKRKQKIFLKVPSFSVCWLYNNSAGKISGH